MKVWGLLLCVVLVATLACVVAAPEGVLPTSEEVLSGEPMDVMIAERACTAARCRAICRSLGFPNGVCTGPNTCRCYR